MPSRSYPVSVISSWTDSKLLRLENRAGLRINLLPNGAIGSIEHAGILVNQFRGILPEGAPFRLWLRNGRTFFSLLNPAFVDAFGLDGRRRAVWHGRQAAWTWQVLLELDAARPSWTWHVEVAHREARARPVDVLLAQDVGLASLQHARINENYNAQYIDHAPLPHPAWGTVLCARQNLVQSNGHHPWLALACPTGAASFATDAVDVFGLSQRTTGRPLAQAGGPLPSRRLQGEFACAALQSRPVRLARNRTGSFQFRLTYVPHHPAATARRDLARLRPGSPPRWTAATAATAAAPPRSAWDAPRLLHGLHLDAATWDRLYPRRRDEERTGRQLDSFFTPGGLHVVSKAKESIVARSHGHVLLGSNRLLPDDGAFGSTVYAPGIFNAQTFCGNPDFSRVLTVVRDPLQRLRASGQRIWICAGGAWRLLGTPSAFAIGRDRVDWWYRLPGRLLRITSRVLADPSAVVLDCRVVAGPPLKWRATHQLCLGTNELDHGGSMAFRPERGQIVLTPDPQSMDAQRNPGRRYRLSAAPVRAVARLGDDALLWSDRISRQAPFAVVETHAVRHVALRLDLANTPAAVPAKRPTAAPPDSTWRITRFPPAMEALADIVPWFRHDAWIHLAAPHGLEQYGGGAWGTRDVCQGPVEWLLGEQRYDEVREILRIVFSRLFSRPGLWPQWFMLGAYADVLQRHCHGDILFWPIKALCDYAETANDPGILDLPVPWLDGSGAPGRPRPLLHHIDRVLNTYRQNCVGGTALVAYGEGDWDDTLQPARPEMRVGMVSAWTVQLAYHAFRQLAELLRRAGADSRAAEVAGLSDRIRADFHRHLMPDGIVAGFALLRGNGFKPLLHPRDSASGIQYRLLPMTRGILSGIFDPAEARTHRELIREHLRFPDGVRLMNRPVAYSGGIPRRFQRAETAAYFGREVALQYVHAHLRYAEAMARLGDADETWWALQTVNPAGLAARLPCAAPRQANVYFSSSDGDFPDRYEAMARFDELRDGRRMVKAGWRLYSSGPGLYLHKVRRCLFGIWETYDRMTWDPMLPPPLAPCRLSMRLEGRETDVRYAIQPAPAILVNGRVPASTAPAPGNPYRAGGFSLDRREFRRLLDRDRNVVQIGMAPFPPPHETALPGDHP